MTATRASRKIAVLTEGEGEYATLSKLYPQIHRKTVAQLMAPVRVNVSPTASPGLIARASRSPLLIEKSRGAEEAILLLDREQRSTCPGRIATEVEAAIEKLAILPIRVVLKDRSYENWLIADITALEKQRQRFDVSEAIRRSVTPNKADLCDAGRLLKKAAIGDVFHKVQDARRICERAQVENIGANSRSFRHFLHVVAYQTYTFRCRRPSSSADL